MRAIAIVRSALVLSLMSTGMSNPAAAQSFNQFVGFGDSNIDSGFYRILPSPGAGNPTSTRYGRRPSPMVRASPPRARA